MEVYKVVKSDNCGKPKHWQGRRIIALTERLGVKGTLYRLFYWWDKNMYILQIPTKISNNIIAQRSKYHRQKEKQLWKQTMKMLSKKLYLQGEERETPIVNVVCVLSPPSVDEGMDK